MESAFDLSGLALIILLGLQLCLLLVGDKRALDVSIDDTLLCKCLKASYGDTPFFKDNSGGNDFNANSAGCGGNGRSPFGGRKVPGGGIKPLGGRFVIAGGNGNSSVPGNPTVGDVMGATPPVDKEKNT